MWKEELLWDSLLRMVCQTESTDQPKAQNKEVLYPVCVGLLMSALACPCSGVALLSSSQGVGLVRVSCYLRLTRNCHKISKSEKQASLGILKQNKFKARRK